MREDRFDQLGKELLRNGWTLTEAESGVEQMMQHLAAGRAWSVAALLLQKTPPALSAGCPFFSWPYFSETLLREYEDDILEELEQVHGFTNGQALRAVADIRERIDRSEDGRVACFDLLPDLKARRDRGEFSRPPLCPGPPEWWREPVRFEPTAVGVMPPECLDLIAREPRRSTEIGPLLAEPGNRLVVRAGLVECCRGLVSLSGQGAGDTREFIRFGPKERGRYMRGGGWQTEALLPATQDGEPRIALKRIGALYPDVVSLEMAEELFALMGLAIMDARRMKRNR